MAENKTYLVESIPKGMEDLEKTEGVKYTKDVLTELTNQAQKTIDLTAMYWNLLPDPTRPDESGFSEEQFKDFDARYGNLLFQALENAAQREVRIRIIQSPGFNESKQESALLKEKYPDQVEIREINISDWYDSGIMHQKIWVFDSKDIYLGSANMDWKSLTQVKEMGIVLENHTEVAADVTRYFDAWWLFTSTQPAMTEEVWDPDYGFMRKVPAWSHLVPEAKRKPSPLDAPPFKTPYNMENPLPVNLNGQPAEVFITGCPKELCAPQRTYDGDGLVQTILAAEKSVCISVMDFAPVSLYRGEYDPVTHKCTINGKPATAAWWPTLIDALLRAVITNAVQVRLLISKWEHTSPEIDPFLRALRETANAGQSNYSMKSGTLEIRRFYVPGWHSTEGPDRLYPGHTRVNHTKYIVTDQRLNIGTSNMTWDYFTNTAGTSFNTNHPGLVQKLQEIFDRDWESQYAYLF